MHPKDEVLRSYLDHELASDQQLALQSHLDGCADCAARLKQIENASRLAARRVSDLGSSPTVRFSAQRALNRFQLRKKENSMQSIFRRPVWAAVTLVAILAVAMAFSPVRALAGSFLGIFRVQQVRVVSFDAATLESYKGTLQNNESLFKDYFNQYLTITRQGQFQEVKNPVQASRLAGFTPRLPSGTDISSLGVNPAETGSLKINSALMNSVLANLGRTDVTIPSDLDGQTIDVSIPAFVTAEFVLPSSSDKARLIQLPSPTIKAPDSFPVIQLGESMFQLMGMTPEQAHQLSQSIDWGSTLVVPVPTGQGMTLNQVTVDGVSGNLVTDSKSQQYSLFWIKNGIVYGLIGSGDSSEALKLANSLQ